VNSDHEIVFRERKIKIGEMRYYFDGDRRRRRDMLGLMLWRKIAERNGVIGVGRRRDGGKREIRLNRGYFREMMPALI